jgi:iron complex transport system substrate-binding protein
MTPPYLSAILSPGCLANEEKTFKSASKRLYACTLFFTLTISLCAAMAVAASPVTVLDKTGRKIVVTAPFKRIISLYGAHTENLFGLGAGGTVIGVSKSSDYPPAAKSIKRFSYHDDAEKFLAAAPDLVLVRPMIDRGYPQLMRRLEKSGISVVSLQPNTIAEMYQYWQVLGLLTGRKDTADKMVTDFKKAVSAFRALSAGIQKKERVYFEAIHRKMKTFNRRAMAIFALEAAGGINIAADATQVRTTNIAYYGKERILSKADQIDVYIAQHGAMNRPSISLIKKEPGFKAIKAIKDDRIYIINEAIVSRPTMRLLLGIYTIGQKLYPQIFDDKAKAIVSGGGL